MPLEIRIRKLLNLDDFATDPPFVKIKNVETGQAFESANSLPSKSSGNFQFDSEYRDNYFVIDTDYDLLEFNITVCANDKDSEQLISYPGVGNFTISVGDVLTDTELDCPLLEDGDPLLEIGNFLYSCKIVENTQQHNHESDQRDNQENIDVDTGDDFADIDKLMGIADNMDHNVTNFTEDDDLFHIDEDTKASLQKSMLSTRYKSDIIFDVAESELPETVSPLVKSPPKKKKKKKNSTTKSLKAQDWMEALKKENLLSEFVRKDLDDLESKLNKIVIHFDSVLVNCPSGITKGAATIKVEILPVPGNAVIVRSVKTNTEQVDSTCQVSGYTFGKNATVSMGVGDTRSKLFKCGACPRVTIGFSCGGLQASASVYLPSLLRNTKDNLFALPLSSQTSNFSGTVLLEINPVSDSGVSVTKNNEESKDLTDVDIEVLGFAGSQLKPYEDLCMSIELLGSGVGQHMPMDSSINVGAVMSTMSTSTVTSLKPELDIVQIRLLGKHDGSERAVARIPLEFLIQSYNKADCIAFTLWNKGENGIYNAMKAQIVCRLAHIETRFDKMAGATSTTQLAGLHRNDSAISEWINDDQNTATPTKAEVVPELVKCEKQDTNWVKSANSTSGILNFGIAGFVAKSSKSSRAILDKASLSTVYVELSLIPEGVQKKTKLGSLSDFFTSVVEWFKAFSLPLTYSEKQRILSNIRISVYAGKKCVGELVLDVAPFLRSGKCLPLSIPLFSNINHRKDIDHMHNDKHFSGWLVAIVEFHNSSLPSGEADIHKLESISRTLWSNLSKNHFHELSSADKGSPTHIAISSLQLQKAVAVELSEDNVIDMTIVIACGSHYQTMAVLNGSIDHRTATIILEENDVVADIFINRKIGSISTVYLLKGSYKNPSQEELERAVVLGISTFPVAAEEFLRGVPINFNLFIRNPISERFGGLNISLQSTAIVERKTDQDPAEHIEDIERTLPLVIEFVEGHVTDASWVTFAEPFFECTVLNPDYCHFYGEPEIKDRSGFIRLLDKNTDHWDICCKLLLTYNPTKAVNTTAYSIVVVCRDASKRGCPELGWARVSLPVLLLSKGRPIEQWVTLAPPQDSTSQQRSAFSRVKLLIRRDKEYETLKDVDESTAGIGGLFFKLNGINYSRVGVQNELDNISACRVKTYVVDPADYLTLPGDDESKLISEALGRFTQSSNDAFDSNDSSFSGCVLVSGGMNEIKVDIRAESTGAEYNTNFSVMSAITVSESGSPTAVGIPHLDLTLVRSKNSGYKAYGHRNTPLLSMDAMFVPYVKGRLVIDCVEVKLIDHKALRSSSTEIFKGAFRYVMSNHNSTFLFSDSFEMKLGGTESVLGTKASRPELIPSKSVKGSLHSRTSHFSSSIFRATPTNNLTYMPIDTREVIKRANTTDGTAFVSLMPLMISLLEMDSEFENGSQSSIAVGHVSTASLYYQALHAAAASSLYNPSIGFAPVATSPCMTTSVDLVDPASGRRVAIATYNIRFVVDEIPRRLLRVIDKSYNKAMVNSNIKARAELGLKQSFILSDANKSGYISPEEMLAVIKSFNDGSNSSIPGLEKTTSLLFSLAGAHVDVEDIGQLNDADLIELVRKMFKQLDVDGDGLISWWEWKAVLSGRMLGRNPESRYIDPMDTLIIAIQAAHAAIEATQENKGSAEPHPMVGDSSIPFIKADEAVMQGAHPHTLSQLLDVTRPDKLDRIPVEDDIGLEFPDGFSTKKRSPRAVVKLQNMVQSLRLTNSILAQKFEQALIRADQTNNVLGADNNQFEKTVKNVSRAELHLLERRIREAEKQAEQSNRAFLSAKSRGDDLANQLQTLKNASEGARVNRERISNSKIQDQIQSEIASHQLKIREIKVERMRRAKATMKVALFLKQVAAPKLRTSRVERAKSILLLHIYAFTFRKRIKNFILRKNNAARKIQSAIRGKISREALKVQRQVAVKIQSVARRKQAGIVYAELKEEKARRDEEKAEAHRQLELLVETMWVDRQARKVQQAIRDWVKSLVKAKNKAAKKIQDSYRSCRRRAELKVKIEEQKKLRAIEEAKEREKVRIELRLRAAVRIQRAIHRRAKRKELKKLQFYLLQQKYCEPLEEKPRIQDCAGFWLKFELEDYEMDDPIQGVLRVIDSVNKETRLLRVKLLAIDPTTGNVMASYKDISYDHPDISIHKVNIPPEILAANAVAARDEFRPKLEDAAKGYFVIYTGDGSEMHEQMGKVLASDVKDRTLKVGFHPMNGDFTKGQVRTIPYDHPYLFWSKDGKLVKPEITEEKALIPSKAKIPDNVKQTIGYRVEVQSHEPDAEPGDTFPGIVVGYNEKSKMIKVSFDTTNNPNEDCEEIFWEKDEIAWMKEPKTEKRKAPMLIPETVEECIGYVVNVREVVPDTEEVDSIMLPGKIISGDKENDTVCVRFDGSTDEEPDDVYYSRTSTDIQYALAPKHSKLLQITARPPNTLVDAVARDVRIWQVSEDQEHAAVWTGKIFSVNVANNSALVLYEKGSGTPGGSEDVLWGSDSFIWITKNSIGKEEIIQNKHPDNIGDAVGYEVQIKSSEPDAEDGDMFAGKIISIDRAKCTVKVLFDSDANDEVEQDTEDVPFESTDIYWVKAPLVVDPVKLDLRRDFSVSRYPNRVQSTGDRPVVRRPNTITAVGGWNVSVRCDDGMEYTGEILSVNAAKSIVSVVFNTTTQVKSEADLEVEDIPFDSPIIVWHGKLSSSNNEEDEKDTEENEKAKKPSITDCVGWYVYIQDEDGELLGRVTDFNLNEEIILVIFYDEDGILDTEDVQQLPYNKEPMLWYENLEDAYRKK